MSVLPGFRIGEGEQGVVVQGFLEVRLEPFAVGRIAAEAAAKVVINAAPEHLPQGTLHSFARFPIALERSVLHQENQIVGRGEFGLSAKAAVLLIVGGHKLFDSLPGQIPGGLPRSCLLPQIRGHLLCGMQQGFSVMRPLIGDGREQEF